MNNIDIENLKLETWKAKLQVFKQLINAQPTISHKWAMENILGFSKEKVALMKEKYDKK